MDYNLEQIKKRTDRIKSIQKVTSKLAFILLVILVYNIFLVGLTYMTNDTTTGFLGYNAYIITTSSMEPNINSGDVVIIKSCDSDKIKIGDVITFKERQEVITHRVIDITKKAGTIIFSTKGDNNTVEDVGSVIYEDVLGKQVIRLPLLGKLIMLLKNQIFIIVLVIIGLTIYLYICRMHRKKEKRREKKRIEDKKYKEKNT